MPSSESLDFVTPEPVNLLPAFEGRVGFIGTGKMATALAKGLIGSKFVPAHAVLGSDVIAEARRSFTETTGARTTATNAEILQSDVVFLAVKPQQVAIEAPGGVWMPRDERAAGADEMTLREALLESNNAAAVMLQQRVGTRPVLQLVRNLGVRDQPDVPSLALGSGLVTPTPSRSKAVR